MAYKVLFIVTHKIISKCNIMPKLFKILVDHTVRHVHNKNLRSLAYCIHWFLFVDIIYNVFLIISQNTNPVIKISNMTFSRNRVHKPNILVALHHCHRIITWFKSLNMTDNRSNIELLWALYKKAQLHWVDGSLFIRSWFCILS